ncbi:MAG: 4-hydroxythreonine-4-phosphate dehydrogenase PdxA [candidate division WOR-3 bacterium]
MIGITIGDPAGIGPEIVLKTLANLSAHMRKDLVILGNRQLLQKLQGILNSYKINLADFTIIDAFDYFPYQMGKINKRCGIASFLQLHFATHLLKTGFIKGIVTAPVCKAALRKADFPYDGQTEYFAHEFNITKYGMLAWSSKVKIILVTTHKPLKEVPHLISKEKVLEKIILLNNHLEKYEKIKRPRIGVFSLNPHAWEFSCGAEGEIFKAIKTAQKFGILVNGPIPVDSLFAFRPVQQIQYDGFVAMYHDQAMLIVKLLSAGMGVNLTVGLSFIRTAPLHGVAFDIANQLTADYHSMLNAIELCQTLSSQNS